MGNNLDHLQCFPVHTLLRLFGQLMNPVYLVLDTLKLLYQLQLLIIFLKNSAAALHHIINSLADDPQIRCHLAQ